MSENDMNEQRPIEPPPIEPPQTGPAVPRPDAGWRPPVAPLPDASSAQTPGSDEWAFDIPRPEAETGADTHAAVTGSAVNDLAVTGSAVNDLAVTDVAGATATAPPAQAYPGFESPYATQGYAYPTADYQTAGVPAASYQAAGYQAAGYQAAGYQAAGYQAAGYQAAGYQAAGYPAAGNEPVTSYPVPGYPTTDGPYGGAREAPKSGGLGRKIGVGVLLIALMAGSGIGGAAFMHHLDGDTTGTRLVNGIVVDNVPPLDRSSLASIASAVRPSVVSITTGNAEGSGVVLSEDGYILTNNHVAATADGKNVDVTFSDGTTVKASLVGTDPKTDLAVFKAQGLAKKLTVAKFGNSSALQVGDTVLAIGSPLGLNGSVTEGIVSALNRTIDESSDSQPQDPFSQTPQDTSPTATIAGAIQTDAAINPGNSGGALVNMNGEVVGINTAIATSGNGADGNIGVGFAIPSNRAKEVADDLIRGVKVSHPYLGIGVVTADGNGGALVKSVTAGSPAASAGLKENDLITAFDGQPVYTEEDLVNAVQASTVGTSVALSVTRDGAKATVNVTLGESK